MDRVWLRVDWTSPRGRYECDRVATASGHGYQGPKGQLDNILYNTHRVFRELGKRQCVTSRLPFVGQLRVIQSLLAICILRAPA